MTKALVCRLMMVSLITAVSACSLPTVGDKGIPDSGNPPGQTGSLAYTPTAINEEGKGEILFWRVFDMTDTVGGVMTSSVNVTIPFTLRYSSSRSVWELKGNTLGTATMEYHTTKPSQVDCGGTWSVDVTASGVMVPMGGLIANKNDGCYVMVSVTEAWEKIVASCSTHLGNAEGIFQDENFFSHNPVKLYLINGSQINSLDSQPGWNQALSWTMQKLDVPLSTGCMVPIDD